MKYRSNQFFKNYDGCIFEIFLTSSYDDDIVEGHIDFFDYIEQDGREVKKNLATINFFIFNIYNFEDMLFLADSISLDLEYVVNAYNFYGNNIGGMGSTAIIDELILYIEPKDYNEKLQIIKYFLVKTIEKLQIIGTGTLLFMSKALILNLNKTDKIYLINELLDINCIPIYQDENDVVLARNLEYIV